MPQIKPVAKKPASAKPSAAKVRVEAVFERLAATSPSPKTELEYVNPYTLLVAVVLSAQATDAGVNKATRGLFTNVDTPAKWSRSARPR